MDDSELDFIQEDGRIFAEDEDGRLLCEVKWTVSDGVANIHRTFVHESLGGRGLAGQLVQMAYDELDGQGLRVEGTCSYAAKWLLKNKGIEPTRAPSCTIA